MTVLPWYMINNPIDNNDSIKKKKKKKKKLSKLQLTKTYAGCHRIIYIVLEKNIKITRSKTHIIAITAI